VAVSFIVWLDLTRATRSSFLPMLAPQTPSRRTDNEPNNDKERRCIPNARLPIRRPGSHDHASQKPNASEDQEGDTTIHQPATWWMSFSLNWGTMHRSNIVISRIFSAYSWRFPLISAANAEEESAFFGGSFGQNRCFSKGRKAIFPAVAAAAQVTRSRPRCAACKSLFGADGRGVKSPLD
jgi:hypothetical protein